MTALKAILIRMMGTAFKAVIAKTVLIHVLRLYARSTETRVDDKAVDLLEALLKDDVAGARRAVKKLSATYLTERRGRAKG